MTDRRLESMEGQQRRIEVARPADPDLGPLAKLPGRWVGQGRGWNMIALPFALMWAAYKRRRREFGYRGSEVRAAMFFAAPWTIGFAVLGFNLLGDALRDALDPRAKRSTMPRT